MLDREHVVVAMATQHRDERLPELVAVTVSARAEVPRAVLEVAVRTRVVVAIDAAFVRVELGVLRVAVEEQARLAENARALDRIDALPEEVRRIEVRAEDRLALEARGLHRRLAEADERVRVVDAEAGVRFPRDLDAVLRAETRLRRPVRDEHALPLVLEDGRVVRRPRAGDPVGHLVGLRAAGAAREGDHDIGAERGRELDRVDEVAVIGGRVLLVGVDGVSVHGEARERQAVVLEDALDPVLLLLGGEDLGGIEERLAGIRADRELDRIEADLRAVGGDVFEFAAGKECGHHAKLHGNLASLGAVERAENYHRTRPSARVSLANLRMRCLSRTPTPVRCRTHDPGDDRCHPRAPGGAARCPARESTRRATAGPGGAAEAGCAEA